METIFIFAIRRPLKNPPLGLFKAILGRRHENKSKSFPKHAVRFLCDIYEPRYHASKLYDEDSWVLSNVESDWGPTLQPGPLYIFLFLQLINHLDSTLGLLTPIFFILVNNCLYFRVVPCLDLKSWFLGPKIENPRVGICMFSSTCIFRTFNQDNIMPRLFTHMYQIIPLHIFPAKYLK